MATIVRLPQMGQTMQEATITRWHVKEGDRVDAFDPLFEMLTDKVNMDVEADVAGVVLRILQPEGAVVPVQQPVVVLGEAGEDVQAILSDAGSGAESVPEPGAAPTPTAPQEAEPGRRVKSSPRARRLADESGLNLQQLSGLASGPEGRLVAGDVLAYLGSSAERDRVRISPLANRMATEEGMDPRGLAGTGPGGKITRQDVARASAAQPAPVAADSMGDERIPLSGLRKLVAENVARSQFTAPHVTLTAEADVTDLVKLREQVMADVEQRYGVRLSFTEFVTRACALALRGHPWLNASLEGETIVKRADIHVGIAVALEQGLMVPVIRHADRLAVPELSRAIKELARQARDGRLAPDALQGGTFTITNLGAFGVDAFTPILNPPQAAILGVGRVAERPAVVSGQVVPRWLMVLSLTFDHRVTDAVPAARFLADVRGYLEAPYRLLV